jgi:hypothetical protein
VEVKRLVFLTPVLVGSEWFSLVRREDESQSQPGSGGK